MRDDFNINRIKETWKEDTVNLDKEEFWQELEPHLPSNKSSYGVYIFGALCAIIFNIGYELIDKSKEELFLKTKIETFKETINGDTDKINLLGETETSLIKKEAEVDLLKNSNATKQKAVNLSTNELVASTLKKTQSSRINTKQNQISNSKQLISNRKNKNSRINDNPRIIKEQILVTKTRIENASYINEGNQTKPQQLYIEEATSIANNKLEFNRSVPLNLDQPNIVVLTKPQTFNKFLAYRSSSTISDLKFGSEAQSDGYVDRLNNLTNNRSNWYQELSIGMRRGRMSFSIGLRYTENRHRFEHEKTEISNEVIKVDSAFYYIKDDTRYYVPGNIQVGQSVIRTVKHTNKERLVTVPLRLTYYITKHENRLQLHSFIGTHFTLHSKLSGKIVSMHDDIIELNYHNNAGVNFLSYVEGGLGMEYKISSRFNISGSVISNLIRNKYLLNGREIKFNNKAVGLELGVNYKI